MTTRRSVLTRSAALAATLALPRRVFAQAYPTKPIKIIVPFPPGGPADSAVRIAQPGLEKALGQPIIIENVAGAAARSAPSASSSRSPTATRSCRRRARTPPTPR